MYIVDSKGMKSLNHGLRRGRLTPPVKAVTVEQQNIIVIGAAMKCDLCENEVNFDNGFTYEGVAGSKLCRSCFSKVVDNSEGDVNSEKTEGPIQKDKSMNKSIISKKGIKFAAAFIGIFSVLFLVIIAGVNNPGNSGEAGIYILPFVLPWLILIPDSPSKQSSMELILFLSALLNSFLIYLFFGGAAALVGKWKGTNSASNQKDAPDHKTVR